MSLLALAAVFAAVSFTAPSHASTASGVFSPKSTTLTLTTSAFTFKAGAITIACTLVAKMKTSAAGTTASADATPPGNQVNFTNCKAVSGLVTATVVALQTWTLSLGAKVSPTDDSWAGNIAPGTTSLLDGAVFVLNTGCELFVVGAQTIDIWATDSATSVEMVDSTILFTSNNVGIGCPAAGFGVFTASGAASMISTPAFTLS